MAVVGALAAVATISMLEPWWLWPGCMPWYGGRGWHAQLKPLVVVVGVLIAVAVLAAVAVLRTDDI